MKEALRLKKTVVMFFMLFFFAASAYAADPVVVELHYQNGVKYYKRGIYDKSVAEFEKVLDLDPKNEDARMFLEKVKLVQKNQTSVDTRVSQDERIKELRKEGAQFFREGKYQEAIDTFNKVLEIRPIDDYASFYKEKSEIILSKKVARERKIEQKQKLKEARRKAAEDRKTEREEIARKRKEAARIEGLPADKGNRESVVDHDLAAYENEQSVPEAGSEAEAPLDKKERLRQERLEAKQKKVQAKLEAKEEKKKQKEERIAAKKALREERRQEKERKRIEKQEAKQELLRERQERRAAIKERKAEGKEHRKQEAIARKESIQVEKGRKKQAKKEAARNRLENKQLFLKGVEQYGHRQYEESISTFTALIEAESMAKDRIYSNTAQRLMQKAKDRLEGKGKDKEIEK